MKRCKAPGGKQKTFDRIDRINRIDRKTTRKGKKPLTGEHLAELNKTVTPVTSAVQMALKNLDSGPRTRHFRGRLRRNDVEGLLQEAPDFLNFALYIF